MMELLGKDVVLRRLYFAAEKLSLPEIAFQVLVLYIHLPINGKILMKKNPQFGVIRLHNAVFYAYHGVLTDEQNLGGKFEVDVDLHCDLSKGTKSDHLSDTVNYERVYDCIRTLVLEKSIFFWNHSRILSVKAS